MTETMSSAIRLELKPEDVSAALSEIAGQSPQGMISLNPETVQQDLARLVLSLIEFLRRLLELQAIRRMEHGALSADEEEEVGLTLFRAREQIAVLAKKFGLKDGELNLDLGPLGKLM